MVGVYEEDNVRLSDFFSQSVSLLRQCRGIDNGRSNIFWSPNAGWYRNLRKDGLNLVGYEDIFDEGSDQARFSGGFIPTDNYPNFDDVNVIVSRIRNRGLGTLSHGDCVSAF